MDRLAKYESRARSPALLNALAMAVMSGTLGLYICLFVSPPTAWRMDMPVPVTGSELWTTLWSAGIDAALYRDGLLLELGPRLAACGLAILVAAVIGFRLRRRASPIVDGREHYEGLQLLRGKAAVAAANAALAPERRRGERPIQFAEGITLPHLRAVRNILILGAIGSGKTRIILFLIETLIGRLLRDSKGDHALFVHDTTGEILDGFPMSEDAFAALHPHSPGGYAWNMGRDFHEISDCETAADQMVDQTGEAVWGKGGSTLFAGCMIVSKAEHGQTWGVPELYDCSLRDPVLLKQQFEQYYPPAAKLIEIDRNGELSKTTISFLLTYRASVLRVLRPLAEAWGKIPAERQFSFSDWVTGVNPHQPRVVIVQRSGRHPEMSAAWIGMVIDAITAAVGDPSFSVSQTRTRDFVLDEVPALGRLRRWGDLLDTARNKGISTIAAGQDLAQFKRIYGKAADSILQRFWTKVVCAQTHGPEGTELAEQMIGKRSVLDQEWTTSVDRGAAGRTERASSTQRPKEVLIVRPEHLAYRLGVRNRRIRALVVGLGDILELEWPMRIWRKRR